MLSLYCETKHHKQSQFNIAHFIMLLAKHVYCGTVFTDFITFLFSSASAFLFIFLHNVTLNSRNATSLLGGSQPGVSNKEFY